MSTYVGHPFSYQPLAAGCHMLPPRSTHIDQNSLLSASDHHLRHEQVVRTQLAVPVQNALIPPHFSQQPVLLVRVHLDFLQGKQRWKEASCTRRGVMCHSLFSSCCLPGTRTPVCRVSLSSLRCSIRTNIPDLGKPELCRPSASCPLSPTNLCIAQRVLGRVERLDSLAVVIADKVVPPLALEEDALWAVGVPVQVHHTQQRLLAWGQRSCRPREKHSGVQ